MRRRIPPLGGVMIAVVLSLPVWVFAAWLVFR